MASSNTTRDHDQIRQWAEARGAKPAAVASTESGGATGILRLAFPGAPHANDGSLQEIDWDEFFEKFDSSGLEFLYEDQTADGQQSNFNKLVYPESSSKSAAKKSSSSRKAGKKPLASKSASKKTAAKKGPAKRAPAKKAAPKKAAQKTAAKKSVVKKSSARQPVGKNSSAVKRVSKGASRKTAAKKSPSAKAAAKTSSSTARGRARR